MVVYICYFKKKPDELCLAELSLGGVLLSYSLTNIEILLFSSLMWFYNIRSLISILKTLRLNIIFCNEIL